LSDFCVSIYDGDAAQESYAEAHGHDIPFSALISKSMSKNKTQKTVGGGKIELGDSEREKERGKGERAFRLEGRRPTAMTKRPCVHTKLSKLISDG